jgi:hypothetical protein
MRGAATVEPELVVVADSVDHQRVVLPAADRMAPPRRDRVGRMRTAVHVDDTMRACVARFVQHVDMRQTLRRVGHRKLPRIGIDAGDAHRQAGGIGLLRLVPPGPEVARPRQQRQLARLQSALELDIDVRPAADPWPGEIHLAIGQPRNRLAARVGVGHRGGGQEDVFDFASCGTGRNAADLLRLQRGRRHERQRKDHATHESVHRGSIHR